MNETPLAVLPLSYTHCAKGLHATLVTSEDKKCVPPLPPSQHVKKSEFSPTPQTAADWIITFDPQTFVMLCASSIPHSVAHAALALERLAHQRKVISEH
ncbi:hypothetical protein BaRGS_00014730 [Batillaria attramentaria]|uniref:Uncharacterized protein n=1 Tax=Batillaria attramentaria TaxID=370345 RepID=A0ABD0L3S4_9CAEN